MDYQILIKIPLEAVDDVAARQKYKKIIEGLTVPEDTKSKLQRVYKDRAPEGIKI